MNKQFVPFLPPWAETGLQPAFYDVESGTVLQQVSRMYAKVNQLIRNFNDLSKETKDTVEEYIAKFIELKDFVDDYFDNLDVQEEINNKLDEMLEDGSLQDLVNEYLETLTKSVDYIFPKNWDGNSGDANLIIGYGKNILIDTYRASLKSDLYQMLSDNGVTHIDYLILTHYHDDHIGNAVNLINDGYVDSYSYVFIPPDCQQIIDSPELTATKNAIIVALQSHNVPYSIPAEESVLSIDDEFSIEFYNTDSAVLSAYSNYNDCSTMCLVKHLDKLSFYTGDCLGSSLNRAYNNGFVNKHIDLYKIQHHGIGQDLMFFDGLNALRPTYAYQPSFIKDFVRDIYSNNITTAFLKGIGTHIYSSHLNRDYIKFQSFNNTFSVLQGKETPQGANNNYVTGNMEVLYVDASTTGTYQDGTQAYPFLDLPQAIGSAIKKNIGRVHIILDEGQYCVSDTSETAWNTLNKAYGLYLLIDKKADALTENVVINNDFILRDCDVEIKDVTLKNNAYVQYNFEVTNCNIKLTNCVLDGSGFTDDVPNGIYETDSHIVLDGCTASGYNLLITGHGGNHVIKNCTFSDITTVDYQRGGLSLANSNTYSTVTNHYQISEGGIRLPKWIKLYGDTSVTSGTIALSEACNHFNKLLVISGAVGAGTVFGDEVYSFYPDTIGKNSKINVKTVDGGYELLTSADGLSVTLTNTGGGTAPIRRIYGCREYLD